MNNLDLLVVKRSQIESMLDVLAFLSPKSHDGRLTTFLPFVVKTSPKESPVAAPVPTDEVNEIEGVEGELPLELKPALVPVKVEKEEVSLLALAKQKVNQDFVCFEWLQDFGSPVCKKSIEEFIEEVGTSICNKQAICNFELPSPTNGVSEVAQDNAFLQECIELQISDG